MKYLKYFVHEIFRFSIGIGTVPSRVIFIYREVLRLSIDRGTGANHDLLHLELRHDLHQVDGARHVVLVVLEGEGTGLPHGLQGCEVHDSRDLTPTVAELPKHLSDLFLNRQICSVTRNRFPRELFKLADHI